VSHPIDQKSYKQNEWNQVFTMMIFKENIQRFSSRGYDVRNMCGILVSSLRKKNSNQLIGET
jgi:hypothetical protein